MKKPRIRSLLGATLLASALSKSSFALEDAPRTVVGRITRIDGQTVELGGQRGVLAEGSDVRSDGRSVSAASIRAGMQARMEVDERGRILELRVEGVLE
ncbi:hypothetical protein KGQ64_09190 [bacterium]|nr:hypothetical protein [bacterium]